MGAFVFVAVDDHGHPRPVPPIELETDEDGDPITSCVVLAEKGEAVDNSPRPKRPSGNNQRIVLEELGKLLRESKAFGRAGAPPSRPCIELDDVLDKIAPRMPMEPKRRRERVQQAINGLHGSGILQANEGWLWLA